MSEEPKKEEQIDTKSKEEPKECQGKCPKGPGRHLHKHKERKCECGEVIPKRKEGEPKIKVCPKCGKDLPKKKHGFGMRCHKMKKWMKFMKMMRMMRMMRMMNTWGGPCGFGFGPRFHPMGFNRGLEVHHYIHFGPPSPFYGRPSMGPFGFCRPPMCPPGFGRPPCFGRPPMGPPGFGRFGRPPMMGPPGFGRPPMGPWFPPHMGFGPHGPHGPCGPSPCKKKEEKKE